MTRHDDADTNTIQYCPIVGPIMVHHNTRLASQGVLLDNVTGKINVGLMPSAEGYPPCDARCEHPARPTPRRAFQFRCSFLGHTPGVCGQDNYTKPGNRDGIRRRSTQTHPRLESPNENLSRVQRPQRERGLPGPVGAHPSAPGLHAGNATPSRTY